MFYANSQEILTLLLAVKYSFRTDIQFNYSDKPRPCHNFVFMLEGEARITSDQNSFSLKAGQILYIPKNTTYTADWIAAPRVVFHSLHFNFQPQLDPLSKTILPVQVLSVDNFDDLYLPVKEIETMQYSKNVDSFFVLSDFYKLCGKIFSNVKNETHVKQNETISPAITYIEQNYTKSFSVEYLASLCFLSASRFFYLFKEQTGVSPIAYKNRLAIQYTAQELLAFPQKNIATIANDHGFKSLIYFERIFKKLMGKSPSRYRKEERLL